MFLACGSRDLPPDTIHQYLKPLDLPNPFYTYFIVTAGHSHVAVNAVGWNARPCWGARIRNARLLCDRIGIPCDLCLTWDGLGPRGP